MPSLPPQRFADAFCRDNNEQNATKKVVSHDC